jgi:hypothetical protein
MRRMDKTDQVAIALRLNVSMPLAEMLVLIYNEAYVSADAFVEMGLCQAPRRMVAKLRQIVGPLGVEIRTHRGTGYWVDDDSRQNLRLIVQSFQPPPARDVSAEIAAVAAVTRESNEEDML